MGSGNLATPERGGKGEVGFGEEDGDGNIPSLIRLRVFALFIDPMQSGA